MFRRNTYYTLKPLIPLFLRRAVRGYFARRRLRNPAVQAVWPILESAGDKPAGWPGWPEGKQFAFVLTHDVESSEGLAKVRALAELEMSLGFRSSFNFIPEGDYAVPEELRSWLVANGFEIGVHDLHHDGKLYRSREEFAHRAKRINGYVREWGAVGYRSGFMLHNYAWHHDLDVLYDASSFDTDPFEPQPDGVGTIFPFFIENPGNGGPKDQRTKGPQDTARQQDNRTTGPQDLNSPVVRSPVVSSPAASGPPAPRAGYVELPYTLPQDSTLFFLLGETTDRIWRKKLEWVAGKGGMALLNTHPDYMQFGSGPSASTLYPAEIYASFLRSVSERFRGQFNNPLPKTLVHSLSAIAPNLTPPPSTPADTAPGPTVTAALPLAGKRAAVLLFSFYPSDPRPRRAALAMVEAGMQVDFFCLRGSATEPQREFVDGINVVRLPIGKQRGSKLGYFWQYGRFIATCFALLTWRCLRRRYDIVHVHNMPDILVFAALPARLRGAKVILDLHDPMPELMTAIYKLQPDHAMVRSLRIFERWSLRFAHLAFTPNITFKKIFVSRGCPPEKMQIIMNSPQQSIFDPDRVAANGVKSQVAGYKLQGESNADTSASFGSQTQVSSSRGPVVSGPREASASRRFRIMHHGSIVHRHGVDLLVEAVAAVRADIPGIRLDIYGGRTPFLDTIVATAGRLGVADFVHYHGEKPLEEIAEAILHCDLGVVPNRRSAFTETNFPTRLFEYLAMRRPVLAPSTAGIRDYFAEDHMLYFNPDDPHSLADRIRWAYQHPDELRRFVIEGIAIYRQHLWQDEKRRLIDMTASLLTR